MSTVLIYTRGDGGRSVFWPVDEEAETIARAREQISAVGGTNIQQIDSSAIPPELLSAPTSSPDELEARCRRAFDEDKLFRAKCVSDLAFRLGKAPGQLTGAELTAERDRLAAIYRAL